MVKQTDSFIIKKYSPFRKATADLLHAAQRKNMAHALIEVDITETRRQIRKLRNEKKQYLSLLGYMIYCTARALNEHKNVQAYRDWRNRLIIFDHVDVSTTIERKINDEYVVIPKIIRSANHKSMSEISTEIMKAKKEPLAEEEVFRSIKMYLAIPVFIRRLVFRMLDRFPQLMKKKAGTIMVTSAHSGVNGSAWGIPVASHTLNITLGGISRRPIHFGDGIDDREFLSLTISFDHAVVDGAPMARFLRHLYKIIETGIQE